MQKNVSLENASLEDWTYGTEGKLHIFSQNFVIESMLICAFLAHQAASVKGVKKILKNVCDKF